MKITISSIAKMGNVSKATVSRVINNKSEGVSQQTKDRILKLIEDVGYKPNLIARSIVTSHTQTIGLIIPDIQNSFFPQMVRAVEDFAASKGYTVFLCNSDGDFNKQMHYLNTFVEKRVDGIILTTSSTTENTDSMEKVLKHYPVPLVLLDRKIERIYYDAGVFIDNVEGARMATQYLLKGVGNGKVAYLGGPEDVYTARERLTGYRKAHEEAAIPINNDLIYFGEFTVESGYQMAYSLMSRCGDAVSGIFAASDVAAVGVLKALRRMGVMVPHDIEVIGFDNISICEMLTPSLSTVAQPIYEIGRLAAQMLVQIIDGDRPSEKVIVLPTELVIRETTRKR